MLARVLYGVKVSTVNGWRSRGARRSRPGPGRRGVRDLSTVDTRAGQENLAIGASSAVELTFRIWMTRPSGQAAMSPGCCAPCATAETGERFLEIGVRSTIAVLENIEKTFEAMPPR